MYNFKYALFIYFIIFLLNSEAKAQIPATDTLKNIEVSDSLASDTSSVASDTLKVPPKGDIQTTIKYSSRDSISFDVVNQTAILHGEGKLNYANKELTADSISINYRTNILTAAGSIDSTGKKVGLPVFADGPEKYSIKKDMRYNIKSQRAIIEGVVTQQGEAYMHGDRVKKNEQNELFMNHARYTTCNLEHPHFHLEANKIKVIPEDKVVTGPFVLYINEIPTPFFFPFGMFPAPRRQASGIIIPTYGEEKRRGFYLQNGGYYWDISEYMNLTVTGEAYTSGSNGFTIRSDYRKRYAYNGNFNFRYNKNVFIIERDTVKQNDFFINWSQSPQSKGVSRFSISVNAGTSTYNRNVRLDQASNLNSTLNSSVSYSTAFRLFGQSFNTAMSARHNQNVRTNVVTLQLPEFNLGMNRVYPFKNVGNSSSAWYKKLSFQYNMNGTNTITNQLAYINSRVDPNTDSIAPFNFETIPMLIRNGQNGIRHRIPLNTSIKFLKYFNLSPNFNYDETWYFRRLQYGYDNDEQRLVIDTISGFNRLASYSGGVGVNTMIYGTKYFKSEKIQAIRHQIIPNISFSYRPDFSSDKFGYYQTVQIDSTGRRERRSRYQGFVYGTPGAGESAALSFSLNNNIEMKIKSKNDTTGKSKKVPLLEGLSFSSSYNMIADSFKLAPISMGARTRLFDNKWDIAANAQLDPYVYRLDSIYLDARGEKQVRQRRIDAYSWNYGRGIGQISSASLSVGTSFNPKAKDKETGPAGTVEQEEEKQRLIADPTMYVDFSLPWDLRVNYVLNYTKRGYMETDVRQSMTFSGNLKLTEKWNISFNSGYDFKSKEFIQTNFNVTRDLHCWMMNFSWTPFGYYESYSLDVHVKASQLADILKIPRRRTFQDRSR